MPALSLQFAQAHLLGTEDTSQWRTQGFGISAQ